MKLASNNFFCWGLLKDRVRSITFHGHGSRTTINRIRTSNRFDENPGYSFPRILRDFGANVNNNWGMSDYDCANIADIPITFHRFVFTETNPTNIFRNYFYFTSGATKNSAVTFNDCQINNAFTNTSFIETGSGVNVTINLMTVTNVMNNAFMKFHNQQNPITYLNIDRLTMTFANKEANLFTIPKI
jgi:hypothetical protein